MECVGIGNAIGQTIAEMGMGWKIFIVIILALGVAQLFENIGSSSCHCRG